MKQRLIYILKHSLFLQSLYRVCVGGIFRFISAFVPINPHAVLFVSYMGTKYNDSPKAIYEYMQSHTEYSKYHCVWAFVHPKEYPELNTVKIDSPSYFIQAFRAKYWITNTNIERGLQFKKKRQKYLNTWHGIALKHIGNDCPGRKDYNFDTVDYLCVSGNHDEIVFKSAFNAKQKNYLRCGLPRNDALWRMGEKDRISLRSSLGIPDEKSVVLYAPTWRDSVDGGKNYTIKPPIDFKKWEDCLGEKYIILFRAHHMTTKVLNVVFNNFIRDFSDYEDVNELMAVSDILITDYSSIAFDFSILSRPIFCFAYDYDSYLPERGTYIDVDIHYPEKSYKTEDELLQALISVDVAESSMRTKSFRTKYVTYGGTATECCVQSLFKE